MFYRLLLQIESGAAMSKLQAIIHYRIAISIFRKWLDLGIINEEELQKIDALIAGKYDFPVGSIYR